MKASGTLRHHFWGDYSAGIGLTFSCPESALACLPKLPGWKQGTKHPHVLVACLNSAQLDEFKTKAREHWQLAITPCGLSHCRHQCQDSEIDHCNHSVDYGADFTVDIPAEHVNQLPLL